MITDFEQKLEKYAEVIVKVGLNIQPGQRLLIGPPLWGTFGAKIELAPLITQVAIKAYQAGARLVDVMWDDEQLRLIRLQHAPRDSFEEFPMWRANGAIEAAKAGDALLSIASPNFDLFAGQDPDLINKTFSISMKHMKPFMKLRGKNAMNFAIVAAPNDGWADKVFPDLSSEDRKTQFWDVVFEVCRVKHTDPVLSWNKHVAELSTRCDYLNSKGYAGLYFTASGTDLRLGLPDGYIWKSAKSTTQSGIDFIGNLPTEEIFTIPHKAKTEGVVTSTKSSGTNQGLIDGLTLTFSNGKVIKATAKKGEDIVHRLLDTDDGSKQLGEIALVPNATLISQSRRLFYIPLYDENASCHLALGNAYRFCLEGGEKISDEEFSQAGGNISQNHADFMFGSEEIDVDGIKDDGSTEPLMRSGEWAFDV